MKYLFDFFPSAQFICSNIPGITQACILMWSHLKTGINPPPHAFVRLTFEEKLAYLVPYIWQLGAKRGWTMATAILIWPYFGPDCAWICVGGVESA